MKWRVTRREILQRLERVEAQLAQRAPAPIDGQEAISVATIGHHTYEGPGACRAHDFGVRCGQHRDAHQHQGEAA